MMELGRNSILPKSGDPTVSWLWASTVQVVALERRPPGSVSQAEQETVLMLTHSGRVGQLGLKDPETSFLYPAIGE